MGWTPPTMAKWVADNLGPTLAASKFNKTLILALDDQRFNLPWYIEQVFSNKKAKHYISGTAVHWYGDMIAPPSVLDRTHDGYPDKFILMTEACEGTELLEPKVILGSWDRGEKICLEHNRVHEPLGNRLGGLEHCPRQDGWTKLDSEFCRFTYYCESRDGRIL